MTGQAILPAGSAASTAPAAVHPAPGRTRRGLLWLLLLLASCMAMPGCGGCGGDADEVAEEKADEEAAKEKAQQKEKPKKDFEDARLYIQPNMPSSDRVLSIKPGHWTLATAEMKANNFHYTGELRVTTTDRTAAAVLVESTPYQFSTIRSAPLPKGQQKFLEFTAFVPREIQGPRLTTELRVPRGGLTAAYTEPLTQMPPYQYYFLILSTQPEAFRSLTRNDTKFDTIRAPGDESNLNHYKVVAPAIKKRVPLPTNPLAWSSIAYILYDDIDPSLFDADQRQALLDWLHWGGQLVISGPGSLDKLKGSFLDPSKNDSYLPAAGGESVKLQPSQIAAMGQPWITPGKHRTDGRSLVAARPWAVVELKKHPEARFVENTQQQVIERQIGRGRIAVTSFRIGQPSLLNWPCFDCFLNAVLLRREPRQFIQSDSLGGVAMRWLKDDNALSADITDARRTTTQRYFSRDVNDKGEVLPDGRLTDVVATKEVNPNLLSPFNPPPPVQVLEEEEPEVASTQGSGIAGWNDFKGVATAARASLREAAGIKIPNATFVIFVLAVYLVVLVPLNWGIFRVVGRIELAWVAAPLIAIAGAAAVIKLAELDIGFARSQTEISVLEAQNNYPRGHLTRFTALYASLGTTYDLVFDDKNAVALPFADPEFQRLRLQTLDRVEYHRDETGARLAGFTVNSNSTGMIHSEQMYDLGGVISYTENNGRHEVYNHTKYAIYNAGIIRRVSSSKVEVAWLGDLQPGMGAKASFTTAPARRPMLSQWNLVASTAAAEVDRPLQRLLNLAQQPSQLDVGEVRLLGIIREPLSGMTVEPEPSQSDRSPTLLVANLKQTALISHPPRADANSRSTLTGTDDPQADDAQPDGEAE